MDIPYTRDKSAFQGHVLGWSIVFLVEGLVIATLILVFAPTPWLKVFLTGAFIALLGWFVRSFLMAPARTRHRLTETTLELRFGSTRIDIPRMRIVRAEAVESLTGPAFTGQPVDDEASGEVRLTFSHDGLIRLSIEPPLEMPRKNGIFLARHVIINADNRDAVLAAFNTSTPLAPSADTPLPSVPFDLPIVPLTTFDRGELAIETIGLTRRFGTRTAVDDLSIRVRAGEIYGFIGPNGAGKTTTISMLVGMLAPTSGVVRVAGYDMMLNPVAAKTALGYVPDRPVLYETLTARENLEFIAQLRGQPRDEANIRIDEMLDQLDLRTRANDLIRTYSFGMRNKVALAAAMLHRPEVLILDEPFNGLDPQTSYSLRTLILDRAAQGTAVLLSTHDLSLVERMCHRVGVINRGRLVAEGEPDAIRLEGDLEAAFLSMIGTEATR